MLIISPGIEVNVSNIEAVKKKKKIADIIKVRDSLTAMLSDEGTRPVLTGGC